ncbi:chemotaxis protein CheD [Leptothrix sp. BB-4]
MPSLTAPATLADVYTPPRVHVLNPGDVRVVNSGDRLDTLLGSCVAVTLVDPRGTVGAMCHVVHASDSDPRRPPDTHHARDALQAMADGLLARGITPRLCLARVYGGANMFPRQYAEHVGLRNVQRVLELLTAGGIRVLEQNVGGTGYRKLSWRVGPDAPVCRVVDSQAPA